MNGALLIEPSYSKLWVSLVAQQVKNQPAMQETWVRSLIWKDPLEKGKATHFSILAWRIPRTIAHHFMGNRWGDSGNSVRLYFLGSKITADGDCSHAIKRRLLLGRKVMTNLDSILKNRDITLPTKVRLVKAMVFPVLLYGCES